MSQNRNFFGAASSKLRYTVKKKGLNESRIGIRWENKQNWRRNQKGKYQRVALCNHVQRFLYTVYNRKEVEDKSLLHHCFVGSIFICRTLYILFFFFSYYLGNSDFLLKNHFSWRHNKRKISFFMYYRM